MQVLVLVATAALEHPSYCLETKGELEAGMQIRREEVEVGVGLSVFEPSSGPQNNTNVVFPGTVRGSGRRSVFASSQPLGTTQSPPKQGSSHPLITSAANQTSKPLTHPHCLPGLSPSLCIHKFPLYYKPFCAFLSLT